MKGSLIATLRKIKVWCSFGNSSCINRAKAKYMSGYNCLTCDEVQLNSTFLDYCPGKSNIGKLASVYGSDYSGNLDVYDLYNYTKYREINRYHKINELKVAMDEKYRISYKEGDY